MLSGIIVGLLLGFVLQRGRFCVVGAYRDVFLSKKFTIFIALFIVVALQSIGVWALHSLGYISIKPQEFYWL
ncbi:YeeE/YedE family protein, partial [Campylobacter coli]|nr:YeeE/YedE family protein [Campylobacter coli]